MDTAKVYTVAGGAPLYIGDCAPLNGCPGLVDIIQNTIDTRALGFLRSTPTDGTYIRAADTGKVYTVAGGAPLYLSNCQVSPLNGCPGRVDVIQHTIESLALGFLRPYPVNATTLRAAETGNVYVIAGGAPLTITDCGAVGCSGGLNVNQTTIDSLDHLLQYPEDGAFLRAVENDEIHRVAGGAPIRVDDCPAIGGCDGAVGVNARTLDEDRDHLREFPADGTVLVGRPSDTSWIILLGFCLPDPTGRPGVLLPDAAIVAACGHLPRG